jgi:hypothetical protein
VFIWVEVQAEPAQKGGRPALAGQVRATIPCAFYGELVQFRVLGFRSDEDGDVGISVFPQREHVLIELPAPFAMKQSVPIHQNYLKGFAFGGWVWRR